MNRFARTLLILLSLFYLTGCEDFFVEEDPAEITTPTNGGGGFVPPSADPISTSAFDSINNSLGSIGTVVSQSNDTPISVKGVVSSNLNSITGFLNVIRERNDFLSNIQAYYQQMTVFTPHISDTAYQAPSFCNEGEFSTTTACFGSSPSLCEQLAYANNKACFGSAPSYCSNEIYGYLPSCFGSHPSYCSDFANGDEMACIGSRPAYCLNSNRGHLKACIGSLEGVGEDLESQGANKKVPTYCSQRRYSHLLACVSSKFVMLYVDYQP